MHTFKKIFLFAKKIAAERRVYIYKVGGEKRLSLVFFNKLYFEISPHSRNFGGLNLLYYEENYPTDPYPGSLSEHLRAVSANPRELAGTQEFPRHEVRNLYPLGHLLHARKRRMGDEQQEPQL